MVVFPNIKINLGLRIVNKRSDGYHNIDSCFYPVNWCDVLEVIPAKEFSFATTGTAIDGEAHENLCMKAYKLLQANYSLPPMNIHLHKVIPIGAGLGGGSSDAAFIIKTINQLLGLGMSEKSMQDYASQIGSDCPFFIRNKPMLVAGRGERLTPAQVSLSGKYLIMVFPNIHVSTQEAYSKVKPKLPALSCEAVLRLPIAQWKELLVNDFEKPIFELHPKLAEIKQELYDMGAIYASMSGSGSSIYGIFSQMPTDKAWGNYQTFGTWLP